MNNNKARWLSVVAVLILAATAFVPANISRAQGNSRTFPETGQTVQGRFLQYWDTHGGLAQQGFPISAERQEKSDTDGKTYTVQYFERAVFELHPENQPPNDVLLSLLGVFIFQQKYPNGEPTALTTDGQFFDVTKKHVSEPFLSYWNTHGGLAQQGYPISERFLEKSDLDGKTYEVQYFERAVFELHPENAPPYNVLLSQLGTFRLRQKQTPPTATPAPVLPTPTQGQPRPTTPPAATPTTSSGADCSGIPASSNMTVTPNCAPLPVTFNFVGRGFRPGENVGVYATMPDQAVYGAPFQATADSSGTVGGIRLSLGASAPTGIWAMTMEGTSSHAKAIGYFKVVTNAPAPPPPSAGCDTSGSHDGTATPSSVKPGQTVVFRATGVTPGERVSYWFTLPDGQVFGTPAPVSGGVNGDGTIGPLSLPIDSSFAQFPGRWAITFEGASSHHQAVIYFCISQ